MGRNVREREELAELRFLLGWNGELHLDVEKGLLGRRVAASAGGRVLDPRNLRLRNCNERPGDARLRLRQRKAKTGERQEDDGLAGGEVGVVGTLLRVASVETNEIFQVSKARTVRLVWQVVVSNQVVDEIFVSLVLDFVALLVVRLLS